MLPFPSTLSKKKEWHQRQEKSGDDGDDDDNHDDVRCSRKEKSSSSNPEALDFLLSCSITFYSLCFQVYKEEEMTREESGLYSALFFLCRQEKVVD